MIKTPEQAVASIMARQISIEDRLAALVAAAQCALAAIDATLAARGYREGECTDQWSPEVRGEVAARAQLRAAIAKAGGAS